MRDIGERMKRNYELPSRRYLTRRVPVIVRVDGRAFHTYTRGMERPFDTRLAAAMWFAASSLCEEMQGCVACYLQSDEASFLLVDYRSRETEPWFGYVQSKVESVAASAMTAEFNYNMPEEHATATFDARAFNVPREDVANYFLWRALDWERNSVSMYCRSFFSHKQMFGASKARQHEMLHGIGKNWTTDVSPRFRNGRWIVGPEIRDDVLPKYDAIAAVLDPLIYPVTDTVSVTED